MALRVGVLTFHCSNSCGAVLQAYAMCKTIEELGCSPCVIDYRPKFLSASPPPRSQRPLGILEKVWRKWHNRQFAEAWNNVVRDRRFERFRREFLAHHKAYLLEHRRTAGRSARRRRLRLRQRPNMEPEPLRRAVGPGIRRSFSILSRRRCGASPTRRAWAASLFRKMSAMRLQFS